MEAHVAEESMTKQWDFPEPLCSEASPLDHALGEYMVKTGKIRQKFHSQLWEIFTETTGYCPQDLCVVEQRVQEGLTFKTIFYFDLKHRHQKVEPPCT